MYMRDPKTTVELLPAPTETVAVFFMTIMVLYIGVLPSYFIQLARTSMSL
jgi:hypothetical protein